jgi:CheY-like chemotaxis protein
MRASSDLQGVRVLVIEDEPLIVLLFEDMLSELGCEIVGPASSFNDASNLVRSQEDFDVAILDVKLGEQSVFPVATVLADRGVPIVFSTGIGPEGLPREWQNYSTIPKPTTMSLLATGLLQALDCSRRGKSS